MSEDYFSIVIPKWCSIGKYIAWNDPQITGYEWVNEKILSYGIDGFFHQGYNCPVYFTKFSEYGKTVKECYEVKNITLNC